MANKDDYLTEYRQFFENFAQTVNPNDQLPVKLASYKLVNVEVVGGIIDWTSQYLNQKKCPQSLISTLIKIVIDETRSICKKQPIACGFNPSDNAYEPLKLMQTVIAIADDVCLRYVDNSKLCSLPSPGPPYNVVSCYAIKNSRRRMEDRHVVIHDLSSLFVEQEASPSSYYAIFDGHAGHDAAAYSCAHLHQFLAESKHFISNPKQALREAFCKTDALFLDKCKVEHLSSGTTAVCALLHHKEKSLYIAWVGDSQAILVSQGRYVQCVQPHKPCREDEKKRVEEDGGVVLFWDTWRVNGHLAVSRAIGDSEYKPYVTAVPDVVEITLNGTEDFLILACDGLWDCVSEDLAAQAVYSAITENPDDIESISQRLVQLAKLRGSSDNITVIVVFLRETSKIAAEGAHWATCGNLIMDTLDNANSNPFAMNNSNADIILQKEGLLLDLAKQNGGAATTNGKRSADDEFDCDDDMGPETDVDAVDDVLMPSCNNHVEDKEEKATLETEHIKNDPVSLTREETATPPADLVHDASGLIDNVAESGEDSDDEWNYFKGDTADKENVPPSETDKEVCDIIDNDAMSHLNPNAAEFVPSPNRCTESPALQTLKDEPFLAQSPKRAQNVDMKVPDPREFECEIKSRPSEVTETNEEGDHKLTSEEIMLNLLNGKNIDDIEFHPISTPIKTFRAEEFHFGPNATPFSTPAKFDTSEALSTKAVFGDESTASYLEKGFDSSYACSELSKSQTVPKEQDPMSTSFYQDKDNIDSDPLDLDKVHNLPDDIDEFLEKDIDEFLGKPTNDSFFNDTISDLPEHNPSDFENTENSSKLISSVQNEQTLNEFETAEVAKSPVQFDHLQEELLESAGDHAAITANSPDSVHSTDIETPVLSPSPVPQLAPVAAQFPIPEPDASVLMEKLHSPSPPLSPVDVPLQIQQSLILESFSDTLQPLGGQSPLPPQTPPVALSPDIPQSPVLTKSPLLEKSVSPDLFVEPPTVSQACNMETIVLELPPLIEPVRLQEQVFEPAPAALDNTFNLLGDTDVIPPLHSPVPSQEVESPVEDVTSSVKDSPLLAPSPLGNRIDELNEVVQETVTVIQETSIIDTSSPLQEGIFLSPESKIETESVTTAEVNSFLERSLLPDVASPLSPTDQEDTIVAAAPLTVEPDLVSSLQDVLIKSEIIAPEFPVQQQIVTTPTETVESVVKSTSQKKLVAAKPKTGITAVAAKKPAPKSATTAATKPATKPLAKTTTITAKPAPAKTLQAKSSTTPVSSPKSASKPAAKAPVTNGLAKAPIASALTKTTSVPNTKAVPAKTARPSSASAATKPAVKQSTAPLTSRPTTLANRTSTTTTSVKKTSVTTTVTTAKSTLKPSTVTSSREPPKPRPTTTASGTAPPAPRPKSVPAKPLTKTPDTEKSIKEAANKQTASRLSATNKPVRKVEPKAPTARTSLTKTTPTATKSGDVKKPQELVRHPITNKTKITKTTTKETIVHENGIEKENITVTNTMSIEEPQLIKDVSPLIENSQLLD